MRGRFAPSPTGYMHLGNVWTAFLCWLQVRRHSGTLVLRIENIDEQRSKKEYMQALLYDLHWLGLDWDEGPDIGGRQGPYVQQERYDLYKRVLHRLRQLGLLYPCYCSRTRLQSVGSAPHIGELSVYDGHCYGMSEEEKCRMTKAPSWRIHVPALNISFTDGILGLQKENLADTCGDFIVRRADGMYAYQLAVSVDDGAMGITHVVRGQDLLSSTARQIWLLRLLGYDVPQYTHVPMLIDEEGNRLSKRQQGITVRQLREQGVAANEILSYLAYQGGLIEHYENYDKTQLLQYCRFDKLTSSAVLIHSNLRQHIFALSKK